MQSKTLSLIAAPFILSALGLTACASKIAKQEELSRVRKVAIVGLDVQQQKSVSKGDLLNIALKNTDLQATPRGRTESSHVEPVYQDLARKLKVGTGWNVMELGELKRNPGYQRFFKEKTEGFQNRPIVHARYTLYQATGILDSWAVQTSKSERLTALAKELGVDAVVFATTTVNLNNNSTFASLVGKGEFKPSADTSLFVLDARTGEKIFMNSVKGPMVEKGEHNAVGMANEDNLNRLAAQATQMSMDLALKDLKTKR